MLVVLDSGCVVGFGIGVVNFDIGVVVGGPIQFLFSIDKLAILLYHYCLFHNLGDSLCV